MACDAASGVGGDEEGRARGRVQLNADLRAASRWLGARASKAVDKIAENAIAWCIAAVLVVGAAVIYWLRDALPRLVAIQIHVPVWSVIAALGAAAVACFLLARRARATKSERDEAVQRLRQALRTPAPRPTVNLLGFDWEIEPGAFEVYRYSDRPLTPRDLDTILTGPLCTACKRLVQHDLLLAGPRGSGYTVDFVCRGCNKQTPEGQGGLHTYLLKADVFRHLQAQARRGELKV